MTNTLKTLAALAVIALGSGCAIFKDYDVPNYNAGSLEGLEQNPTPTTLSTAANGMIYATREDQEFNVIILGSLGREGYSLSPSDRGWQNNLSTMNSTSFYTSALVDWTDPYISIRMGNVILKALDASTLTDAQKAGVRGFVKTMQAYNYLTVIIARDSSGAALDVDRPLSEMAPIATRDQVYTRINQLLDDGKTALQAAGGSWILNLPPGFSPTFNSPTTFLTLNRALRARTAVYTQDYATAITALSESFIDSVGSLRVGAYLNFSSNSGDRTLSWLYDPTGEALRGQPTFLTDAQTRADATPDLRVTTKTQMKPLKKFMNLGSTFRYTVYDVSPGAPITFIRNEELILLRAEARWKTGNPTGAMNDINLIRTKSGGLDPIASFPGDAAFQVELLYNRRYSLVWEGGFRWIDARRFGFLGSLPVDRAGDKRFSRIQIPQSECTPRPDPKPAGCNYDNGI